MPNFTRVLEDVDILEGEKAQFECEVYPDQTEVVWLVKGEEITDRKKYKPSKLGSTRRLVINDCKELDSGQVTAIIGDFDTSANLNVRGAVIYPFYFIILFTCR